MSGQTHFRLWEKSILELLPGKIAKLVEIDYRLDDAISNSTLSFFILT